MQPPKRAPEPGRKIFAFAPASIANVGPCYDIMGYALDHIGDVAELEFTPNPGELSWGGCTGLNADRLSKVQRNRNAAFVVAERLWQEHVAPAAPTFGARLTLHKFMPVGSGLGSSAASGVSAAAALVHGVAPLVGVPIDEYDIANALVAGEAATAGTPHPDNVIPSFFGGFYLMLAYEGNEDGDDRPRQAFMERHELPDHMWTVVVKPSQALDTAVARNAVRQHLYDKYVRLDQATACARVLSLVREHSARAARIMSAACIGDVELLGKTMNENGFLERARGHLIERFFNVKAAALDAGAFGCTIAGAGPSVCAIVGAESVAHKVKTAILEAFEDKDARWLVTRPSNRGARLIESVEEISKATDTAHNFW